LIGEIIKEEETDITSFAGPLKDGKLQIGTKKNTKKPQDFNVNHKYVSRAHCVITSHTITDTSTQGTFIHTRTPFQERYGIQSNAVPIDNVNTRVYVYGYVLEIK
jgi:hypothetical protein